MNLVSIYSNHTMFFKNWTCIAYRIKNPLTFYMKALLVCEASTFPASQGSCPTFSVFPYPHFLSLPPVYTPSPIYKCSLCLELSLSATIFLTNILHTHSLDLNSIIIYSNKFSKILIRFFFVMLSKSTFYINLM